VVVALTEKASTMMGWALVKHHTKPKSLYKIYRFGSRWNRTALNHRWPQTVCALSLLIPYLFLKYWLVMRLDVDGLYTVDYYTTFASTLCIYLATFIRTVDPIGRGLFFYTDTLWRSGRDNFVIRSGILSDCDSSVLRDAPRVPISSAANGIHEVEDISIDLHQWVHLSPKLRLECLANYARCPRIPDDTDKGMIVRVMCAEPLETKVEVEASYDCMPGTYVTLKKKVTINPTDLFFLREYDYAKNLAMIERDLVTTAWHDVGNELENLFNSRNDTKSDAWWKKPVITQADVEGDDGLREIAEQNGIRDVGGWHYPYSKFWLALKRLKEEAGMHSYRSCDKFGINPNYLLEVSPEWLEFQNKIKNILGYEDFETVREWRSTAEPHLQAVRWVKI